MVIVFVKAPSPGSVKTRLIPFLGLKHSTELYRCFVEDTLNNLLAQFSPSQIAIAYQPDLLFPDISWISVGCSLQSFVQNGTSLGEKISNAVQWGLQKGDKSVVIGSDAPHISVDRVVSALAALAVVDVVLGPTLDGGFYLIAQKSDLSALFRGVKWSSSSVCSTIKANAISNGWTYDEVQEEYDIDVAVDLFRLREELLSTRAPRTFTYLEHLERAGFF